MLLDLYDYMTNLQRHHFFLILSVGYLFYYLVEVVKRPFLAVRKGPFQKYLLKYVPTLEVKYWPTFWCFESRAQTVFASFIRASILSDIKYEREVLKLKDGGEVALDWFSPGCAVDAPVIIILPGLTGESQAEYIKCLVMQANQKLIKCVVFNNRGLGGVSLKTPRLYCAANCEDISEVMNYVHQKCPNVKKGATGISMGGLILGNYLSEHADEAKNILTASKIISVPWNVEKGSESIEKPYLNSMLNSHLCGALCDTVKQYDILYGEHEWKMDNVLKSKTIKEFDSRFTSIAFGFGSVDNYYKHATLHNKLHKIKVPTLCLSAADDPFQPLDAIPIEAAEKSSHVAIVVTARGGHIGFLEGFWPGKQENMYMARIFVQYFTAALFDIDGEFARTQIEVNSADVAEGISLTELTEN